jgi:hypothetical protein
VRGDACRLLDHLRELGPAGLSRSDLHKRPPAGLGRSAAKASSASSPPPGRGPRRAGPDQAEGRRLRPHRAPRDLRSRCRRL